MTPRGWVLFLCASSTLFAQSARRPAVTGFEVATIRLTAPDPPGRNTGRYFRMQSAHQFYAHNYTPRVLIALAWNLTPAAVSGGPSWFDSDHYDILAKTPAPDRPALEDQMSMLRALIVERFGFQFHLEPKEFSVYALTVARNGSKLKPGTPAPDTASDAPPPVAITLSPGDARFPGKNVTLAEFCSIMQRTALGRPVVDRTGLSGRFDFDLEWTPDQAQFDGLVPRADRPDAKPDLFTAIQEQMGLRLESTRGMVGTIVVDHVSKPGDN